MPTATSTAPLVPCFIADGSAGNAGATARTVRAGALGRTHIAAEICGGVTYPALKTARAAAMERVVVRLRSGEFTFAILPKTVMVPSLRGLGLGACAQTNAARDALRRAWVSCGFS